MRSRLFRFLAIIAVFLVYTLFKALQMTPEAFAVPVTAGVFLLFVVMLSGSFIHRARVGVYDKVWFKVLTWIGTSLMGLWGTFILLALPLDILSLLLSHWLPVRALQSLAFPAALIMTLLGFFQALRGPGIRRVEIPIKNLPPALEGLKIAQISDLHVGVTIRSSYVQKVVDKTNSAKPDLIVVTGDLADAHASSIRPHLERLSGLRATYGKFYATGNHEYYWGAEELLPMISAAGLEPLLNAHQILDIKGAPVAVAGVTDPMGVILGEQHLPDLKKALQGTASAALRILLAHRPDVGSSAEEGKVDVQFSGHTHAGQFFPFSLFVPLAHRYYKGLNKHGNIWVYVNPGTGYWGPANRFGISSEITLAILKNA